MTDSSGTAYKIRGDNPLDWVGEANRVFELLSVRLDNMEGYRGHAKSYNYMESMSDVLITDKTKGVVLTDTGDPTNYWRVTIDKNGMLVLTNIGRVYP